MANLIGTAGHVDHGKTTLIRALTGIDTDRLPEEKRRGLTIDIGFAYLDLPGVGRASIVDVPGHERFVTNMLVGALGMDVALLCVAADESVMPQTVEHFLIIELLPVERMVVALTRCDLADRDAIAVAKEEVQELLATTRFKGSPIVEVSATTGLGLEELKVRLAEAMKVQSGGAEGDWYMPIDRAFAVKGHGVVVTGTMAQGTVHEGDSAVLMPERAAVRVRSVESHDEPKPASEKGKRTALNLSGIKTAEAHRGQVVGSPGVVFATSALDAKVRWLAVPKHGARLRVSIGADEAIAKVFLNDHDPALAQFRFERTVAAAKGQPLIVRLYSPPTLLGGGRVTIPEAKLRRKSERATSVAPAGDDMQAVLQAFSTTQLGIENDELCRIVGKSPQALGDTLERLKASGALFGFAGLWMTPAQFGEASLRYLDALSALHEKDATALFQPREAPLKSAGLNWSGKPFDRIVARLVEEGKLRTQGTNVALAEFRVKFSDKQRVMLDRVIAELGKNGLSVPSLEEVTRALKVPPQAVEATIKLGLAAGEIVRIAEGIHVPTKLLEETVQRTRQAFKGKQFSASEFREALQTTRKYAIPVLEHFDAKGVTKRLGDQRVVVEA